MACTFDHYVYLVNGFSSHVKMFYLWLLVRMWRAALLMRGLDLSVPWCILCQRPPVCNSEKLHAPRLKPTFENQANMIVHRIALQVVAVCDRVGEHANSFVFLLNELKF